MRDLHDGVHDRHSTLISARPSRNSKRFFFDRVLSAMSPTNGLETIETKAPSAKKIEVYRWVRLGSSPMRCSNICGSNGTINAKSSSSSSLEGAP